MNHYIFKKADDISRRFGTRDPFAILSELNVDIAETDRYKTLKGFCFLSCRTIYVRISSFLSDEEKRIVAAHELGHILLHRQNLKLAPMKDSQLFIMNDKTEYEANLFAADLLLSDSDVESCAASEELDFFDMCRFLETDPQLMSFKLYSMIRRGHNYNMPMEFDSRFLGR